MPDRDSQFAEQDVHTILAALRFMQANLDLIPEEIRDIATNGGEFPLPDAGKLDALCESINLDFTLALVKQNAETFSR